MPRGRFFCCFAILGIFALSFGQSNGQIYTKAAPSVVLLVIQSANGPALTTGFLFANSGTVATTYGPIKIATKANVIFSNGKTSPVAGVIDFDALRNVALLKIKSTGKAPLQPAAGQPAKGTKTYTIGTSDA